MAKLTQRSWQFGVRQKNSWQFGARKQQQMYTEFLEVNAITLVACGSTMHVMQPKDMFKQARQISRASQDETVPGGEAKKRGAKNSVNIC